MRRKNQKTLGVGATVSVNLKYVHPSEFVRATFTNLAPGARLTDGKVVRLETKTVTRKKQECVVFTSRTITDIDGVVRRWCTVLEEGNPAEFFGIQDDAEVVLEAQDEEVQMPQQVLDLMNAPVVSEDDYATLEGVVEIDYNNSPAPENFPMLIDTEPPGVMNAEWGHNAVCLRKILQTNNQSAKLNISRNVVPTKLQLFEILFPKDYIINVVLKETNKTISFREWATPD